MVLKVDNFQLPAILLKRFTTRKVHNQSNLTKCYYVEDADKDLLFPF